jgi:hypothetical protein
MTPEAEPPLFERALSWVPFVVSAGLVAAAVDLAIRRPTLGLVLAELSLVLLVPQLLQRRKLRRVLRSGDVDAVLSAWSPADRARTRNDGAVDHAQPLAARFPQARADARSISPTRPRVGGHRQRPCSIRSVFDGEPDRGMASAAALDVSAPARRSSSRVAACARMGAFARAFAHRRNRGSRRRQPAARQPR